jgi:hypothetical protein
MREDMLPVPRRHAGGRQTHQLGVNRLIQHFEPQSVVQRNIGAGSPPTNIAAREVMPSQGSEPQGTTSRQRCIACIQTTVGFALTLRNMLLLQRRNVRAEDEKINYISYLTRSP